MFRGTELEHSTNIMLESWDGPPVDEIPVLGVEIWSEDIVRLGSEAFSELVWDWAELQLHFHMKEKTVTPPKCAQSALV